VLRRGFIGSQALLFFLIRALRVSICFPGFSRQSTPQCGSACLAMTPFAGMGLMSKRQAKGLMLAPMRVRGWTPPVPDQPETITL
jgi:hypothetical protein